MGETSGTTFWEMASESPGRTAVATVVPVLVGAAQLVNGYLHGVALTHAGLFAVVMGAAAVLATQYNLVAFRRAKLQRHAFGESGASGAPGAPADD